MAIRIQLRRDTAANWVSTNPVLRAGEFGIETDTLKFKIGNGSSTWTQIANYANVTDAGLSNSLSSYILAEDQGTPGGPAELNSTGDLLVPENSIILWDDSEYTYSTTVSATQPTANRTITLPDATGTMALTSNIPSTTDNLSEGSTNKYFSAELAQDAAADALAAGTHTNITVTYNDSANSISLAAAPGYVDEQAVDAVAAALAAGTHTNITVTYNDEGNSLSLAAAPGYTDEQAQDAIGNSLGTGLSYNDTTGAISVDTTAIQAKVANVDDTEIGYLNGVTSAIQTQIDNKASLSGATFTGAVSGTSLTLSGDLTVNGTTTTLNSTTISVDDKNIELGSVDTPSDATADGGGITLKGATDKTFNWVDATDAWTSSEHINLASGKSLYLNGTLLKDATETLTNKTLTSPVISTISNGGTITIPTTTGTLALTSQVPTSSTTAITSNSAVTIDTIALTDFITAEYQVTIHQGTSTRSSKVLVQTDGTSVDYNEYAIMATGTAIPGVVIAASVSSTNMVLQATITNGSTANGRAFIIKNVTTGVAPAAPTIGAATYGDTQATVTFTPQDNGGSAVTEYTVTSNPGGITASGSSSPITITGLTNGTSYTFTTTATNKYGTSPASSATNSVSPSLVPVVTGGTLASDSTYYYRTFTSTGSLGVSQGNLTADVLTIAAGGGGGGSSTLNGAGGGGAGGVSYASSQLFTPSTYTATIGAGGGTYSPLSIVNGNNSQFGSLTAAVGGGRGGGYNVNEPSTGGSGGGAYGGLISSRTGAAGTAGQGNSGGNSQASGNGGGGGGAGGAGSNTAAGGAGTTSYSSWISAITSNMSGVSGWSTATETGAIASGGGGLKNGGSAAIPGGGGAGGNTANSGYPNYSSTTNATARTGGNGTANTGGGGGATWFSANSVGQGGSGIIIVRYTKESVGG
jgi:Major tropism determinant N-terminal domain/Fibronectin type III domain